MTDEEKLEAAKVALSQQADAVTKVLQDAVLPLLPRYDVSVILGCLLAVVSYVAAAGIAGKVMTLEGFIQNLRFTAKTTANRAGSMPPPEVNSESEKAH